MTKDMLCSDGLGRQKPAQAIAMSQNLDPIRIALAGEKEVFQ